MVPGDAERAEVFDDAAVERALGVEGAAGEGVDADVRVELRLREVGRAGEPVRRVNHQADVAIARQDPESRPEGPRERPRSAPSLALARSSFEPRSERWACSSPHSWGASAQRPIWFDVRTHRWDREQSASVAHRPGRSSHRPGWVLLGDLEYVVPVQSIPSGQSSMQRSPGFWGSSLSGPVAHPRSRQSAMSVRAIAFEATTGLGPLFEAPARTRPPVPLTRSRSRPQARDWRRCRSTIRQSANGLWCARPDRLGRGGGVRVRLHSALVLSRVKM